MSYLFSYLKFTLSKPEDEAVPILVYELNDICPLQDKTIRVIEYVLPKVLRAMPSLPCESLVLILLQHLLRRL